jgi:hypothetical protein
MVLRRPSGLCCWFRWLSGGYFSDVAFLVDRLCIAVSFAGSKVYGLPADRTERSREARLGHSSRSLVRLRMDCKPFRCAAEFNPLRSVGGPDASGAELASAKFTFLPRGSAAGGASNRENPFWAEFLLHGEIFPYAHAKEWSFLTTWSLYLRGGSAGS